MRILVVVGLLVVAAALVVVPRLVDDNTVAPPGADGGVAPAVTARPADPARLPPGTIATNVQREPVVADDLADEPTACLRVVDHRSEAPVAGAAVRRVRDGAEIAFTDERGLAAVPVRGFEQLAVVADGYLLRLAPTRPGSTEDEPQPVRLVPDAWSPRVRFACSRGDGTTGRDVLLRFRPVDEARAAPGTAVPVPADDALLQRAWTEHTMLAGRPVCGDVAVELGVFAPDSVHRLGAGGEIRFVLPGGYVVEAATPDGLVARQSIQVPAFGSAPVLVVLSLQPGVAIDGRVSAVDGAPVPGAEIVLQGGDPLGLVASTDAAGTFRLAPLFSGDVTLHVRHGEHEPRAVPLRAPAADVHIALDPLPRSVLRGRVRMRPDLEPIAGAAVAWQPNGATTVATTTAADGTFLLRATGTAPARLAITAPGGRAYAELVEPGSAFTDYDVWPGTMAQRLDKKLTAVFSGVVVDGVGAPIASLPVRWQPTSPPRPSGFPGRRVLEGATLDDLPLVTTTAADGSFTLETAQLGAGRLSAGDSPGAGANLEAVAGATTAGIRLQR